MTYRRFFRYLLLGCTLLLGWAWYASMEGRASFNVFIPGRHLHCRLYHGAAVIITHEGPYPKYDFQAFQLPALAMHFQQKYPHGPLGALRTGQVEALSVVYRYVVVPLWLPYLLLVGGCLAIWKWHERQMRCREKDVQARVRESGDL